MLESSGPPTPIPPLPGFQVAAAAAGREWDGSDPLRLQSRLTTQHRIPKPHVNFKSCQCKTIIAAYAQQSQTASGMHPQTAGGLHALRWLPRSFDGYSLTSNNETVSRQLLGGGSLLGHSVCCGVSWRFVNILHGTPTFRLHINVGFP